MLEIQDLSVRANGRQLLDSVSFIVQPGERHIVMGRNGSGKSTLVNAIMGRPGLEVTGRVRFGKHDNILDMPVHERARLGIFLSMQTPPELAGVGNARLLQEGLTASGHAVTLETLLPEINRHSEDLGLPQRWAMRAMNVGASGGERKKNELLHLQILNPRLCLLDEIEAGLDRDAVTTVGQMLTTLADNPDKSWIMVSHAPERLGIVPTHVHVIDQGRLIRSGGRELADQIQERGYETLV